MEWGAGRRPRRQGAEVVSETKLQELQRLAKEVEDAGHLLCKGEAFAGCYWDTPKGRVFGLRSTDEGVDVSEIAKQFGGGGHRNAAGFTVPYESARAFEIV